MNLQISAVLYQVVLFLCKNVILNNVFTVFLLHNTDSECMLKSVWWTCNNAVNYVFNMFEEYVNG